MMKFPSFDHLWKETDFLKLVPKALGAVLCVVGFSEFYHRRLQALEQKQESPRHWMLALGLSWLVGLLGLGVVAAVCHVTSYWGWWAWLWAPVRMVEPPVWVFWLGDSGPVGLIFVSMIALVPALITRRGGWAWGLATLAVFPGVLSISGFVAAILAERQVMWFRVQKRANLAGQKTNFRVRLGLSILFYLGFVFWGGSSWILRDIFVGESLFNPDIRLTLALVLLASWTLVETLVSLVLFHFLFAFRK